MSRTSVLAAALALNEFTLDQLVAYSGESAEVARAQLSQLGALVSPAFRDQGPHAAQKAPTWRVMDAPALRHLLRQASDSDGDQLNGQPDAISPLEDLVLAEDLILENATSGDDEDRHVLAATARNHLCQFFANFLHSDRPWWEGSLQTWMTQIDERFERPHDDLNQARVRLACNLILLGRVQTAGVRPSLGLVMECLRLASQQPPSLDVETRLGMFRRLTDIAGAALSPAAAQGPDASIQRFLKAVAWFRTRARAGGREHIAASTLTTLLESLNDQLSVMDGQSVDRLFRYLGRTPDGDDRIAVYTDLIRVLPRQFSWKPERTLIPGLMVIGVADQATSIHLETCANLLQAELDNSPYQSPSALIGQVAHVMPDLAARGSYLDESVYPRSEEARRELLSLVGAPL